MRLVTLAALFVFAGCAPNPGGVGESSSALGYANDEVAFDYFVGQGLSDVQAAAIVGNLDVESGVSPTAVEAGGGPGRGIAQWSTGGRWNTSKDDNVLWYAADKGLSSSSLTLQLDFVWYELTTFSEYGLATLEKATSVSTATLDFADSFERCGTCENSNRVTNANRVLAAYGSVTCEVSGVAGTCIDVSECGAMSGYHSTAGLCPGASNIECCTRTP